MTLKETMRDRETTPDSKREYAGPEYAGDVVPGYGHERDENVAHHIEEDAENPNVHQHMNPKLFVSLVAMSFLWIGSQIPLYLFGSVLPHIYQDIGGVDRWLWMVLGYLIPNAALCPFVGALSDMFGRRVVAAIGQVLLVVGPIVVSTAQTMNTAIGGMVISGLGAGLNELIALAGTAEMVPVRKRGTYIGGVVFTILPFCPSVLWAQLITKESDWRYVGILIGVWNFIGLVLVALFYRDPASLVPSRPKKEILGEVDWVGGALSTTGIVCFMLGMQWGASQYTWGSTHVLAPFIIGIVLIIAFFVWEFKFAKFPMAPPALFKKAPRTMIAVLLITFFSGANFFVLLLFWPTQVYNVYGENALGIGLRALPIGFGIILGAAIALVSIPVFRGHTTPMMIFCTSLMTAGTGAMSVATTGNLSTVYGVVTIASLGVGAVIIPCSIIAQLATPHSLIGTITAITLSIRYVGGAIGFTAYYNIFYHKFEAYATDIVAPVIVDNGIVSLTDVTLITDIIDLAGTAEYAKLKELLEFAGSPAGSYELIITATQEAFALAYRWPYWMSIAFGGLTVICSFFLKDVRHFVKLTPPPQNV